MVNNFLFFTFYISILCCVFSYTLPTFGTCHNLQRTNLHSSECCEWVRSGLDSVSRQAASIAIDRAVAGEELCPSNRAQRKAERSGKGGGGWGGFPPSTTKVFPNLKNLKNNSQTLFVTRLARFARSPLLHLHELVLRQKSPQLLIAGGFLKLAICL